MLKANPKAEKAIPTAMMVMLAIFEERRSPRLAIGAGDAMRRLKRLK